MKVFLTFLSCVIVLVCHSQMKPLGKVYIVEGMVVDRENLQVVPSAILYNDSLGITTTSDENGYFKIVVPLNLIKNLEDIVIDIVKQGYKRNGAGFSFNPYNPDSSKADPDVVWNYDIKFFYMSKNESKLESTGGAHSPAKEGVHGYPVIKLTYDALVASDKREKKLEQLKEGNELVYFQLDDQIGFATGTYDLYVIGKLTHVILDGKKIALADLNKIAKRSRFYFQNEKSTAESKRIGKEVLVFTTTPPKVIYDNIKASLEIELDQ